MKTKKDFKVSRRDLLRGSAAVASSLTIGCDLAYEQPNIGFRAGSEAYANIDHIVVLMLENRSFDHYFGALTIPEGGLVDANGIPLRDLNNREIGEGRARLEYNPENPDQALEDDPDGQMIIGLSGEEVNAGVLDEDQPLNYLGHRKRALHHLPHTWDPMHAGFNGGAMDGFARAHQEANKAHIDAVTNPDEKKALIESIGAEAMGLHTRSDTPILHALADNYTLCDRYFCSVMGPTWPNRFFLHAGTSRGRKSNKPKLMPNSIWGQLFLNHLKGRNYFSDMPWASAGFLKARGLRSLKSFFEDCASGDLPDFCVIDPGYFAATSDHPDDTTVPEGSTCKPAGIANSPVKRLCKLPKHLGGDSAHPEMGPNNNLADLLVATIYEAIGQSPAWERTLFIITYDESGGFHDHVPPPMLSGDVEKRDDFRQLGFRVPTLVIGPWVREGFMDHTQLEHCSVSATISEKWGTDPLRRGQRSDGSDIVNERVASSNTFANAMDPTLTAPRAKINLPKLEIDPDALLNMPPKSPTQKEMAQLADMGRVPAHADLRKQQREQMEALVNTARDFDLFRPARKKG